MAAVVILRCLACGAPMGREDRCYACPACGARVSLDALGREVWCHATERAADGIRVTEAADGSGLEAVSPAPESRPTRQLQVNRALTRGQERTR